MAFPSRQSVHPVISTDVRRVTGITVPAPPMLRQLDHGRVTRTAAVIAPAPLEPRSAPPSQTRGGRRPAIPPAAASSGGVRHVSADVAPAVSGTGINHWWRYQEELLAGGTRLMVNVGTGNLLLQSEDMSVPNPGVSLAYRRTYNSQAIASDGAAGDEPSLYGNGWTSTFGAHLVKPVTGRYSVYDIDGARYDYIKSVPGDPRVAVWTSVTPGQHAVLRFDGQCGMTWTKTDGTIYYFFRDETQAGSCPNAGATGLYTGRLYQIIGRNHNTSLTFSYTFTTTTPAAGVNPVASITATTQSGQSALLTFSAVNGRQLLTSLQRPGGTVVTYSYDASGNLAAATRPSYAAGVTSTETYLWTALGNGYVPRYVFGPRWVRSNGGCSDVHVDCGSAVGITFAGSTSATSTVTQVGGGGWLTPTIADGTNSGPIQPPPADGSGTAQTYSIMGYYALAPFGSGGPATFRDTDGHMINWIVDASGRPTQTQECSASTGQGTTCTGHWLLTSQIWDADNNQTAQTDARGFRTDFVYDMNGNTTAIAAPSTTTSDGTFRPTQLLDYDSNNNVTAVCDQTATHRAGADYPNIGAPPLCSGRAGAQPHVTATYDTPVAEPYGRVSSLTRASGYTKTFEYSALAQGGIDFSFPTKVTGSSFAQTDGSLHQAVQQFTYDVYGNVTSYDKGNGPWHSTYDSSNRPVTRTDADGVTSYTTYNPDGTTNTTETAAQHATGQGVAYAYDPDGNVITETRHHGGMAGQTTKWYDGMDRLIEVMQPRQPDANASSGADYALPRPDTWSFEWKTRYLYDITQGGTPSGMNGPAHGNIFQTQEYFQYTNQSPAWDKTAGAVFDALDRQVLTYDYGANYSALGGPASRWFSYDDNGQFGLLTYSGKAGTTEGEYRSYDERGNLLYQTFMDVSGGRYSTSKGYSYDANGRIHSANATNNNYGSVTYAYDAEGNLLSKTDAGSSYDDAPSTISYSYYPDGNRRGLSVSQVSTGGFNQSDLFTYAYRPDGLLADKHVQIPANVSASFNSGDFGWTYTAAGRFSTRTDPLTYRAISGQYTASVRRAAQSVAVSAPRTNTASRMHPRDTIAAVTERIKLAQADPAKSLPSRHALNYMAPPKSSTFTLTKPATGGTLGVSLVTPICFQSKTPPATMVPKTTLVNCGCDGCPPPDPSPPPDPTPVPTGPPTPQPTPRPVRTFAPVAATYDQYGQISTYSLPSGATYNQFAFDAEGSPQSFWGYGVNGDASHPAKHVANGINIRGEVTSQHFFDGASTAMFNNNWPYFSARMVNGTSLPFRENVVNEYFGIGSSWTPRDGKIAQYIQYTTYNTYFGAACKRVGQQENFTQDGSARDVQGEFWQIAGYPSDCSNPPYFHGILSRSYDFEDHLMQWNLPSGNFWPGPTSALQCMAHPGPQGLAPIVQQNPGTVNYGWGAEGKLAQLQVVNASNHALHWDGDDLLFVTNGNGTINSIKIGSDADINAQGTLIVRDRDWTGSQTLSHDASGYSQWLPPNPFRQGCTPDSPPPASPSYDNPPDPLMTQPAMDAYFDGLNVFQGARTYNPHTTQWTTPDVYAGQPHNPASQKPFMWNKNNSFLYNDPMGFDVAPDWSDPPPTAREAHEMLKLFNMGETDGKFFAPTTITIFSFAVPEFKGAGILGRLFSRLFVRGATTSAIRGTTSAFMGKQVTEAAIREAMRGAPLHSQQSGGISLPLVQSFVDMLRAGKVPPPIRVDGQIIVDGNHRYIAQRLLNIEPQIQPYPGGHPERAVPWEVLKISPYPWP